MQKVTIIFYKSCGTIHSIIKARRSEVLNVLISSIEFKRRVIRREASEIVDKEYILKSYGVDSLSSL